MQKLSFLTWNLSLMARSAQAPQHWEMHDTEAHVRETVLALDPDVVLFQELPGLVPFVETYSMVGPNPRSHSGNLATLVKTELVAPEGTMAVKWSTIGSFATATTIGEITVANVHLAPGRGSRSERLRQIGEVMENSPTSALVIAGDTNTRLDEEASVAALKLTVDRPPRPTWNSKQNRFHAKGASFSAYFSRWFVTEGLTVSEAWVGDLAPIEASGNSFFLSDHFSCGATVTTSH